TGHGFIDILKNTPRYLFDELLKDLKSGHNIRGTIYMECGAMYRADGPQELKCVGETEFVNGVAAMSASNIYGDVRACAGIVGHVDLKIGARAEDVLRSHIAAGHGRFRGIRHSASYDEDPGVLGPLHGRNTAGLYLDKTFREGFACLGKLGLSFDAWLLEPQLPDLIDLARAFPDTTIVLDHVGTPLGIGRYSGKLQERFADWKKNIETLAKCPNVNVKVGGLPMPFAGWKLRMHEADPPSSKLAEQWKPYVDTTIAAFGAKRCMFESNFPVDRFGCDYVSLWNAFKILAKGYSADEKTALFSGTAARVYRVNLN
ncbi:MAG: amidohydrolase family protein, partial [Alphaproteobacteria bacterium]|nr:amidohydrolase family protein [Alphaproteobacteria bacterium]